MEAEVGSPNRSEPALQRVPRSRALAKKLALLLASLLLTAAIVEVGVRLFYKPLEFQIDSRYYEPEPWPFAFRFLPSQTAFITIPEMKGGGITVELNRHGFRGADMDDVAGRRIRIASIGDSFTFGWGLPDFNDQCIVGFVNDYAFWVPGHDVGLAVLAEPGWNPADYVWAYREFGATLKPDVVVVGFFCGDDIVNEGTLARMTAVRPSVRLPRTSPPFWRLATLDWARALIRDSPILTKLTLALGVRPSGDLMRFLRAEPEAMTARWAETFELLAELNERVRADGGRLVVLSYPSLIQVFAHQQLDDDRFDFRRVDVKLETFCRERDITFIPFLPALLADGKLDLFYSKDRHLTPRGQRLCKQVLKEKLSPLLDEIVAERR